MSRITDAVAVLVDAMLEANEADEDGFGQVQDALMHAAMIRKIHIRPNAARARREMIAAWRMRKLNRKEFTKEIGKVLYDASRANPADWVVQVLLSTDYGGVMLEHHVSLSESTLSESQGISWEMDLVAHSTHRALLEMPGEPEARSNFPSAEELDRPKKLDALGQVATVTSVNPETVTVPKKS